MLKKYLKSLISKFKNSYYIPGTLSNKSQDNLQIGKNVSFGGDVMLFENSTISIGDNTIIAYGVIIHTSTHDYNDHPMWAKRIDRPVSIGHDVWIGTGAIILPGVIIDNYSVVGAGSVVTRNVPAGSIVVGNPAKILKYRNTETYLDCKRLIENNMDAAVITESYLDKYCKKSDRDQLGESSR